MRKSQQRILVIGNTQSGKSTLIEAMKKYANPNYSICQSLIGNGNHSHTDYAISWNIVTELPRYKVVQKKSPSQQVPSDLTQLFAVGNMREYEDELNERTGIEMARPPRMLSFFKTTFQIIDTPGMNDTEGEDELHLSRIYDAVVAAGSINLVLIVISKEPLTQELQKALKAWANMFPELQPAFAFVHTKVKYQDLHPDNQTYRDDMRERQIILEDLVGQNNLPHFLIDCDLETTRPIRMCLTNNAIRDILTLSKSNESISITTHDINQTPRKEGSDHHSGSTTTASMLEVFRVAIVVAVVVVAVTIYPSL